MARERNNRVIGAFDDAISSLGCWELPFATEAEFKELGPTPRRWLVSAQMVTQIVIADGDESSLLLRVQQYPWDVDVFPITGATSMCSLLVFVGLDYHDASVRVCVLDT